MTRISLGVAVLGLAFLVRGGNMRAAQSPPYHDRLSCRRCPVPADIPAPTVLWRDSGTTAKVWRIEVKFDGPAPAIEVKSRGDRMKIGELDPLCVKAGGETPRLTPQQEAERAWKPDSETWAAIQKGSLEHAAILSVTGFPDEASGRPFPTGR